MKYGVIICPKCGMARGVETAKKTTSCQCGREIDLSRAKFRFKTDSPMELAEAVAKANASLRGGEPMPGEKRKVRSDPYSKIAERAKPVKDPLERLRIIAEGLTEFRSQFDLDDVRKVASFLARDSPEDILARLIEHNLIYEVDDGKYRSVQFE